MKVCYQVPLDQIRRVSWGLWNGGGPKLALHLQTTHDVDQVEMIIRYPVDGELFGRKLTSVLPA